MAVDDAFMQSPLFAALDPEGAAALRASLTETDVPKGGVLSIPARVIRKDNVDAFWKDLKSKLEAGKAGRAPA